MRKRKDSVWIPWLLGSLIVVSPWIIAGGWADVCTNIYGIFYGSSTHVSPTDGYVITYQASTKTYELKPGGGGGGGVTTVNPGTGIGANISGSTLNISNTGIVGINAGSNITITGPTSNPTASLQTSPNIVTATLTGGATVPSGSALTTSRVTANSGDPLALFPGGPNLNISLNPSGTGESVIGQPNFAFSTNTDGDIVYRIGGTYARLGIGSTNQVLTVVGGEPAWANSGSSGVTSINAGTNITLTGPSTSPTITAAGPSAGTGISVSGNTVTNTGIVSLNAGTNITLSGPTSTPTVTAAGPTAGTGISVSGTTVTNTGITAINAGTGTSLTGPTSTPTVTSVILTTASFVIPAVNSTVAISLAGGSALPQSGCAMISDGTHSFMATTTSGGGTNSQTVYNIGLNPGTSAGATMASGAIVSPGPGFTLLLGANGTILQSNGSQPGWATPTGTGAPVAQNAPSITGTLTVSNSVLFVDQGAPPTTPGQMQRNGSDIQTYFLAAHNLLTDQLHPVVQTFQTNNTYTPTTNTVYCEVECIGCGGGTGSVTGSSTYFLIGGGAGSGSYSKKYISLPTTENVSVGAVGTAGTSGAAGGNGGDVNFGNGICIGKGGSGAPSLGTGNLPSGAAGGVAGTGDIAMAGGHGFPGINVQTANFLQSAGAGGFSFLGAFAGGNYITSGNTFAGIAGVGYGGGATGAAVNFDTANANGAAGSLGICIVTDYVRR